MCLIANLHRFDMDIGTKAPVVQDRLETDFNHDTINTLFANLTNDGSYKDSEFAKIQRRYLAFLISDSLYTDYIYEAPSIRRKEHLKNYLGGGPRKGDGGAQGSGQGVPPAPVNPTGGSRSKK